VGNARGVTTGPNRYRLIVSDVGAADTVLTSSDWPLRSNVNGVASRIACSFPHAVMKYTPVPLCRYSTEVVVNWQTAVPVHLGACWALATDPHATANKVPSANRTIGLLALQDLVRLIESRSRPNHAILALRREADDRRCIFENHFKRRAATGLLEKLLSVGP
jgi:hypothetical protein